MDGKEDLLYSNIWKEGGVTLIDINTTLVEKGADVIFYVRVHRRIWIEGSWKGR